MTDDNEDPVMTRIFDRAFARVEVPPLRAIRARRSRRWGSPLAAALVLVAVIVISGAIGGWLDGRRAPVAGPTLVVTTEVPPSAAPATTPCPVTNRHDAAGVAVSSGDIGLVEIRPGSFPGEKLVVLVRHATAIGDSLELHATAVGPSAGGEVVWSTPATARTTTWGTVVFEVNSKPIGNVGCWRLARLDAPAGDPGIVINLGPPVTDLGAAQVVEIDGYRFTVQLLFDPAYGLHALDAARWSDLEGVGLECTWTRTGPDVPDATELFGPPTNLSELARYTPFTTGRGGGRTGGFPASASQDANVTDVICGMRDASGDHGAEISVWFGRAGTTTPVSALSVAPWRH